MIEAAHDWVAVIRFGPLILPHVIRRDGVGVAVDGVRQCERVAKGALVVVAHPCRSGNNQQQGRCGETDELRCGGPVLSFHHPAAQYKRDRETEQGALVGPREDKNGEGDSDEKCVTKARRSS